MTTCLWTGNTLYTDSLVSSSFLKQTEKFKIPKSDMLLFGSGHWTTINRVWDWLTSIDSTQPPAINEKEKNGFLVVEVRATDDKFKLFTVTSELYRLPTSNQLMAFGSGGDYARGALEAGASPLTAMQVACKLDRGSDLPIYVVKWNYEKGFYVSNRYGPDLNPIIGDNGEKL